MPRCPSCERFVSIDIGEPEVEELDIDEATIYCKIRLTKCCTECGEELEEAILETEESEVTFCNHEGSLEIEEDGVESYDRTEGKGRGMKTFYGAIVGYKVTCDECGFELNGQIGADIQSSEFG